SGVSTPAPSDYHAKLAATNAVDKNFILQNLGKLKLLDTRTPAEFGGTDVRAAKAGHIPGAKNLDWTLAMDRANNFKLKPEAELRALLAERGITSGDEIVAYCQTHHRSAHTYTWLKALGYRVKGYPGAWSDWGNDPATPVET
ncbi:MAG: sulfurtransferase, partial [Nevskiales bacterium]